MIITKGESLCNEAAAGLTALSRRLKIKVQKYDPSRISDHEIDISRHFSNEFNLTDSDDDSKDFVTFVADIQSTAETSKVEKAPQNSIRFSKKLLTESSEVFNRMFNSDFMESKENKVVMKNQSIFGIRYFLDCITQYAERKALRKPFTISYVETITTQIVSDEDGGKSNANVTAEDNGSHISVRAALEAYDICQVYLLPELEADIFNMIIRLLTGDNILDVFNFSMRNHKQELTEISVNYFLTANIANHMKVQIFRDADNSEYYKEWNELISDTIVCTCQNLIL